MENFEEKYYFIQRRYESLLEATTNFQTEISELQKRIILLTDINANLDKALDINKDIMRNALQGQNEMKDKYAQEIQELKEKIKILGG